jgi:hypothetical protein
MSTAQDTSLSKTSGNDNNLIGRELLIDDTRELLYYLETVHPDPYLYSGGRIKFHRRFQNILQSIPENGLSRDEYISLIRPFVASVSDAHTRIATPYEYKRENPGGLPLTFGSVEKYIYVNGVYDIKYKDLIGAQLESVEGFSLDELLEKLKNFTGVENEYHGLMMLTSYLRIKAYLNDIVPGLRNSEEIKASFRMADGNIRKLTFNSTTALKKEELISPKTSLELPDMSKGYFAYMFTGPKKECAILKVDELTAYREMFESTSNKKDVSETVAKYYEQINGKPAPSDFDEMLAGIPSAAELFSKMLNEMKSNGTKSLIIDLSKNTGGNSLMSDILIYMLYGQDALVELIKESPGVKKLSPYLFEVYTGTSLDKLNSEYSRIQSYSLTENDYDFSGEKYVAMATSGKIDIKTGLGIKYAKVPSFMNEIISGENNKIYTPENILVCSSHNTFSSAFTFLHFLNKCGAKIVGNTSGQSGNGFGNLIYVTLKNSNTRLAISMNAYTAFPEEKNERAVLKPDVLLTYEKLKSLKFDPNSEICLALEVIKE